MDHRFGTQAGALPGPSAFTVYQAERRAAELPEDSVRVFCRLAPPQATFTGLPDDDCEDGCSKISTCSTIPVSITTGDNESSITVEDGLTGNWVCLGCKKVFRDDCSQREVYESVVYPVVQAVVDGYNATVFAFGQTASGKTHTMLGPQGGDRKYLHHDEHKGVIPRAVEDLFALIRQRGESLYSVEVAFFEIYNEVVTDLIAKSLGIVSVFRNTEKSKVERKLRRLTIDSVADLLTIIEKGAECRQTGCTDSNQTSSRSHTLIQLRVKRTLGTREVVGKLYLVDLAGSESIKKTHATGQRLVETKNINTSLLALKKVINALYKKRDHIPYKDSMLTSVLDDSIGGNSFTIVLICCSTNPSDLQETISSLRFGIEASNIKKRTPTVNLSDRLNSLSRDAESIRSRPMEEEEITSLLKMQDAISSTGPSPSVAEIHALQQLEEAKQYNVALESKVADLLEKMMAITSQVQSVTEENEELQRREEGIAAKCQAMQSEHVELQKEVAVLRIIKEGRAMIKQKNAELTKENEMLHERVEYLETQLAEAEGHVRTVEENLCSQREETHNEELLCLQESLQRAQSEKDMLQEKLEVMLDKNKRLTAECHFLHEEMERVNQKQASEQAVYSELQNRLEQLEHDAREQAQRQSGDKGLLEKLRRLEADRDQVIALLEDERAQHEEAVAAAAALHEDLQRLESERNEWQKAASPLRGEIDTAFTQIYALKEQNRQLVGENVHLVDEMKTVSDRLEAEQRRFSEEERRVKQWKKLMEDKLECAEREVYQLREERALQQTPQREVERLKSMLMDCTRQKEADLQEADVKSWQLINRIEEEFRQISTIYTPSDALRAVQSPFKETNGKKDDSQLFKLCKKLFVHLLTCDERLNSCVMAIRLLNVELLKMQRVQESNCKHFSSSLSTIKPLLVAHNDATLRAADDWELLYKIYVSSSEQFADCVAQLQEQSASMTDSLSSFKQSTSTLAKLETNLQTFLAGKPAKSADDPEFKPKAEDVTQVLAENARKKKEIARLQQDIKALKIRNRRSWEREEVAINGLLDEFSEKFRAYDLSATSPRRVDEDVKSGQVAPAPNATRAHFLDGPPNLLPPATNRSRASTPLRLQSQLPPSSTRRSASGSALHGHAMASTPL